jgi:hypothetical protein
VLSSNAQDELTSPDQPRRRASAVCLLPKDVNVARGIAEKLGAALYLPTRYRAFTAVDNRQRPGEAVADFLRTASPELASGEIQ